MAPTFCNRCGDAVEEGCDPWDELEELDALSERLRVRVRNKCGGLERKANQFCSPITPTFCNTCRDAVEEGCDPRNEIDELDALLERLKLKHYDLKRKINRIHCAIIRQLPMDVTSTIFEFCLPDFTDHHFLPHTKEDISIPLSLGAICSYWREIAWSTPSLWSSLLVRVTSKHIVTGIAREWLARSGQLPLSIRIYAAEMHNHGIISALADIINQYSTRWSDLDLYIHSYFWKYFHVTDNHAPILKSIRFHTFSTLGSRLMNLNFQLTCPRLERAFFSNFPLNIQCDNLTHLTVESIPTIDSFLILRKTPRLVFCKISGFCHRIVGEYHIGPPVLTSLRSLRLGMMNRSFAEDFLNNLIAPHLEEFSLAPHLDEFNLPSYFIPSMEVVASFLRRSACSLRSFSFPSYSEGVMNFLQSMPSLYTVSILSTMTLVDTVPGVYNPRNILQLVAKVLSSQSTSLQQGFLPNLKTLEYTGELHLYPGNYENLYSLPPTDNVVHGPFHLLKLDLHRVTHIPENMIAYLLSLEKRGVTVNVLSGLEDIFQSSIDYYRFRKDSLCQDWIDDLDLSLF